MQVILTNIASVFLIMGVGFVANKAGILPKEANKYLSPLLISVTTPCMVLTNISSREVEEGMWHAVPAGAICFLLYFVIFCFIAWIICAKVMKIKASEDCGVYMMLFSSVNNGFMGLPITLAIFGEEALFYMVFFQMALVLYIYGPGVLQLHYGDRIEGRGPSILKSILGSGTIAAIIGIVMLALGIHLPEILFKTLDSIGAATTPLSMMVIGIELGSSDFRSILENGRLMKLSLLKMAATPVVTFLMVNWLPLPDIVKLVAVFGSAFPSAVATAPLAGMEGKNSRLASEGVALTTLMSVVTIPLTAMILSAIYL